MLKILKKTNEVFMKVPELKTSVLTFSFCLFVRSNLKSGLTDLYAVFSYALLQTSLN